MAFNTLRDHGCATLIRDLEEMFAVLCWVATFAGAPTSKKLSKSLQKFAKVYKPGSPIGPAMVWTRLENQIKPINHWNKGEHCRHEIYDDLPRLVIQPDVDPAEHTAYPLR